EQPAAVLRPVPTGDPGRLRPVQRNGRRPRDDRAALGSRYSDAATRGEPLGTALGATMRKNSLPVLQIALFLVISAGCAYYVATRGEPLGTALGASMRKNSLAVLQIALFLVIRAGCAYHVATNVLGPQDIRPIEVTVRMPNSGGMATGSPVTYRGVPVGEVAGSEIDQEGVVLRLKIDPRQRIPASTRAVVSMDTPLALQHLDLQPADQAPPHLRDGSVIEADKTEAPLPLTAVLTEFAQLSDSLHEEDISVAAEAL